ncbi:glycosyltransferase [Swingsia samuiensis]|uniref:glycosyltransferase n=1 Tax=Swingsia samuiensis TaxID=1293412 RepID=UPI001FE3AE87|nr:glycosyltransferase [Swingsia samuiensis]
MYNQNIKNITHLNKTISDFREEYTTLKQFLLTPTPRWKRILKSFKAPFIPHLPTPPENIELLQSQTSHKASGNPEYFSQKNTKNILFISGEPNTPGVEYRCVRNAAAAQNAGFNTQIKACADVGFDDIAWADVMFLWRVEYSGHVSTILDLARQQNTRTIFDTDDIVFVPHYARIDLIDGIRSIGATESRIERSFADMRRTLLQCDQGSTTTSELMLAMHELQPVVHLLPNTYSSDVLKKSRLGFRLKKQLDDTTDQPLVLIGYATGSRTHQKDFSIACSALVSVLKKCPHARVVLFREKDNKKPVLLIEEFPQLQDVISQIEWRDMVPLNELAHEFARFDISIAPVEVGNVFCEAKSEIKFLEASLAGSTSIVSPTGPFSRVIKHGETGFFAQTSEEWENALLFLIDHPKERKIMARNAYYSVLWPFSPEAQAQRMHLALSSFDGSIQAAQAGETLLARQNLSSRSLPDIPDSETIYYHDNLNTSDVTVVITSYNYEPYLLDALQSVFEQTLQNLDLIVVDDGSHDQSISLLKTWMGRNTHRFNRLILKRSIQNAGLGGARNIGVDAAETPYIMQLDADNKLRPSACEELLQSMTFGIAYAYPLIQRFNEDGLVQPEHDPDVQKPPEAQALLGDLPYHPLSLISGNRIDAMAMIAKWAWAAAGGYYVSREAMGWEDFDLWCSLAELGLPGKHVPSILADYRQHESSMTNASTERALHKARVVEFVQNRHPWINLTAKAAQPRH